MKNKDITLWHGDCLELMKDILDGSVDCIIADLPYGTTACKWDVVIPFDPLWAHYKRVIKKNGAIVLFCSQPFTSALVMSNIKMFKYQWIWDKGRFANQMLAKKQALKIHEDIAVFYDSQCTYNPEGIIEVNKITKQGSRITDNNGGGIRKTSYVQTHTNYPKSILSFKSQRNTVHSTQKQVALLEYLIKTCTNEGETVLDNVMGSGSTIIACMNTGRKAIGIEKDNKYFEVASKRIREHCALTKPA